MVKIIVTNAKDLAAAIKRIKHDKVDMEALKNNFIQEMRAAFAARQAAMENEIEFWFQANDVEVSHGIESLVDEKADLSNLDVKEKRCMLALDGM